MLLLAATTDKFQLVSSTTSALDVHVSYVDASSTTLVPSGAGKQNTAITTATTTDILAAPGASTVRNMKTLKVRNKGAVANDVTIVFDQNSTDFELHKVTLLAGECLQYIEGIGFFVLSSGRTDRWLRVSTDYVNATTSFTDITGLTMAVESGKTYNFEAHLYHFANATTTGPRFGINGPTLSAIQVNGYDVVVTGVDTTTMRSGSAQAVDTSFVGASLTGRITTPTLALFSGSFTTGAAGTFAIRGQSEVAVAAGLTVRAGSWCHVWEPTG
jgi:hypothetical protein